MILGYLFLAHLLGDFVFQPRRLVLWKTKKKMGLFIHVAIHFLIGFTLLFPLILNGNLWILSILIGINFIHFWVDKTKINYDFRHNEKTKSFLTDQFVHVLIIIAIYLSVKDISLSFPMTPFYEYYSNEKIIAFLCLPALITAIYKGYTLKNGSKL